VRDAYAYTVFQNAIFVHGPLNPGIGCCYASLVHRFVIPTGVRIRGGRWRRGRSRSRWCRHTCGGSRGGRTRGGNDLSWNKRGRWNRCGWHRRKSRTHKGARGHHGKGWRRIGARNQICRATTQYDKKKNTAKHQPMSWIPLSQ
jgi:hypothetical protein